jgi:SAM-dependent methyltransferase
MFWLFADSGFSTFPYIVDALERFNDHEPNHTAWTLASGTNKGFFESITQDPQLAARYSRAMAVMNSFPSGPFSVPESPELESPVLHYPWSKMGKGLVVDIGGCSGTDAFLLAKTFPNLKFVVQDLPEAIAGAEAFIPDELHSRVSFMPYSFLTPQPCTADIYMLKLCLHNWPDHYCVKILRNQIPALKPGARFVIIDGLLPKPGTTTLLAERSAR